MSEWPAEGDDSLGRVDRLCDAFEDAWQQGQRPRIEDYLGDASGEERDGLLRWLIPLDVKYRRQHDETPDLRYYLNLSPSLPVDWLVRVVRAGVTLADRYEIGAEIGGGGTAAVHRGQDRWLKRPVAVKMLRQQYQHHVDMVHRFENEARITSRLQHPSIVPIHDLGESPDGRPCIMMKLVEGHTLAKLLKQRASPGQDLPRLLTLFEQICQTLAYAHAQGVIHRDLKPHNIMVGEFGEVQLMDWGFAKELRQAPCNDNSPVSAGEFPEVTRSKDTVAEVSGTHVGLPIGTLPYMPPEQARGEVGRMDERSDVFGLGAILCEILTGVPPFVSGDGEDIFAKAKACHHGEALTRLDRCGADEDLLQLAKACLEAESEDRPRNAGIVAEKVKAYLEGVQERLQAAERERAAALARAEEAAAKVKAEQRARKLNKALVWASGVAVAALVAVTVVSVFFAFHYADSLQQKTNSGLEIEAKAGVIKRQNEQITKSLEEVTQQRDKATRRLNEVRELAHVFLFDFNDKIAHLPGSRSARELLVKTAQKYLNGLVEEVGDDKPLLYDVSSAYLKVGDVQWAKSGAANLGDSAGALHSLSKALELADKLVLLDKTNPNYLYRQVECHYRIAAIQALTRDEAGKALDHLQKALDIADRLAGKPDLASRLQHSRAEILEGIGDVKHQQGETRKALEQYRQSLSIKKRLATEAPKDTSLQQALHRAYLKLANLHRGLRQPDEARTNANESLRIARRLIEPAPLDTSNQNALAISLALVGLLEFEANHKVRAAEAYQESLQITESLWKADKTDADARRAVQTISMELGNTLAELGRYDEALPSCDKGIKLAEETVQRDPENIQARFDLAEHYSNLGVIHQRVAQSPKPGPIDRSKVWHQARNCYKRAAAIVLSLHRAGKKPVIKYEGKRPELLIGHWSFCNEALAAEIPREELRKWRAEVEAAWKETREIYRQRAKTIPPAPDDLRGLALTGSLLAELLSEQGRARDAEAEYRNALTVAKKLIEGHPGVPEYQSELGANLNDLASLLMRRGEFREARRLLEEAVRHQSEAAKSPHPPENAAGFLRNHYLNLMQTEASLRDYRAVTETAVRMAESFEKSWQVAYHAAVILADCGRRSRLDKALPEAERIHLAEASEEKAMDMLQAALRRGFSDRERLKKEPYFAVLRSRDAFQKILADLEEREQMAKLADRLPRVLSSEAQPEDAEEALMLSRICGNHKRLYAAAARLAAEAFAVEPKLAADLPQQHRYNAACRAALAADGQGEDSLLLPDKVAAMFRRWALSWLRDDLTAYRQIVQQSNPALKQTIRQRLAHWQCDPNLKSLRDKNALDKLPEAERDACQKLWADVAALLKNAQEK